MQQQQQVHLQLMTQAVNSAGLNNKSKRELQEIATALQISNKLKKKELEDNIAKQLLNIFYQNQQQKTNPQLMAQLTQAFERFPTLMQIMNKFTEIFSKSQGSQAASNLTGQQQNLSTQQQQQLYQQQQQQQQQQYMQQQQHQLQQQYNPLYLQQMLQANPHQLYQYQNSQQQFYGNLSQYQQSQLNPYQQSAYNNPHLQNMHTQSYQTQQQQYLQQQQSQQLQQQQQSLPQQHPQPSTPNQQQQSNQNSNYSQQQQHTSQQHQSSQQQQSSSSNATQSHAHSTLNQQQQQQFSQQAQHQCLCYYFPKLKISVKEETVTCINKGCGRAYHTSCLKMTSQDSRENFECFYCILQNYDPIHPVMHEIIAPTPLKSNNYPNVIHFMLSETQYNLLYKKSEQHYLELRCIRVDMHHLYETTWPDYGEMDLNEHKIMEFKPLQMNSSLKKRKDEKFYLREPQILKVGQNTITLKEFTGTQEQRNNFRIGEHVHIFAIYIIKKLNADQLTQKIIDSSLRPEEECKQIIKQNFSKQKDEVHIDKLNVSLNCNFDLQMIKTPAKGRWCKHLQCFSLEKFIIFTESSIPRKWKCPYCKQKCYDLIVDEYLLNIIKDCNKKKLQVSDVTFDENANFSIENCMEDDSEMEEENKNGEINDDISPAQNESAQLKQQPQQQQQQQQQQPQLQQQQSQNNNLIVLDSEDEEQMPVSSAITSTQQLKDPKTSGDVGKSVGTAKNVQSKHGNNGKQLNLDVSLPPENLNMAQGPFSLEKIDEPVEHKEMKEYFMKSLKESQYFYKDEEFDKFVEEEYKEDVQEFISDKITEIANHKITKNIKKQYPEIFSVLKKNVIIPTQSDIYYQQMQRNNSVNLQQYYNKERGVEGAYPQPFYPVPLPHIPPQFQRLPYNYPYYGGYQGAHPSMIPPPISSKKHQTSAAGGQGSVNMLEEKDNGKQSENSENVSNKKQSDANSADAANPAGNKDDPICLD